MVALTKNVLHKAVGKAFRNVTQFRAYLAGTEAIIKDWPLTDSSRQETEVLRPYDFLAPHTTLLLEPS